ncbi:MAG: hypothetical protein Ct9H90mP14_2260 [Methanobacteriota archaeon]|nr:MAG: hypothetical protein Ct9H90mP14_2260 [Euryarchaeota archaeon]
MILGPFAPAAGSAGQIVGPMVAFGSARKHGLAIGIHDIRRIYSSSLLLLPFMRAPERAAKEEIEETLGEILRIAF